MTQSASTFGAPAHHGSVSSKGATTNAVTVGSVTVSPTFLQNQTAGCPPLGQAAALAHLQRTSGTGCVGVCVGPGPSETAVNTRNTFAVDVSCLDENAFVETSNSREGTVYTKCGNRPALLVSTRGFTRGRHYWEFVQGMEEVGSYDGIFVDADVGGGVRTFVIQV